jgi:dipeptidyl aminopeptidase/acylaminoacyl peptidase
MRILSTVLLTFIFMAFAQAQEGLTYKKPPKEILELVDVERPPYVSVDEKAEYMILRYTDNYKSIAELSEKEMRLGGLRINPKTNISSRVNYLTNLKIQTIASGKVRQVEGLPANPRMANFMWSPDESMMAFTHTTLEGVELWVLDVEKAEAKRLSEANINANLGRPAAWFKDGKALLVKFLPKDRKELIDTENAIPEGPIVSVGTGSKAQNRTYQDLLKNRNDEFNFEQLALSELYKVTLKAKKEKWAKTAMYHSASFSPDGEYVMLRYIERPFSYIVPYSRFPNKTDIYKANGDFVKTINEVPLTEELPKGFMAVRTGKRSLDWRSDKPATLTWAEALDEGDPEKEVEYRDELFQLHAPFDGEPEALFKTVNRYAGTYWINEDLALVRDYWWNTRNTKSYLFNPSEPDAETKVLFDRNYQDRYNDPGSVVRVKNAYGQSVPALKDGHLFYIGDGYTPEGQFPFIDKYDVETGEKSRLYESDYTDKLENIVEALDLDEEKFLVRIESATEYPNYYIRTLGKEEALMQITDFKNPFESIQNVHKEVVKYNREDGLELSGTLYLPLGYDKENKERVPLIIWAYPREYKDKSSAAQSTANPNEFTYPYYGSMIYWVTRGYAVLDGAAFPIVGEGDEEPNDSFRKQLVNNGAAAINYLDSLGYIDPDCVAVGGHSYGAFMTANLLSHSDLFAAGIARSGAYNRTLTPFGFQSEERNYWEAPEIYYNMSPFMHADKMKTPLLLIHGEADNNSGTYPMQSERYFNALKGLGATVRLVVLPKESHGYRAKESVLHLLWEQDRWLEKYLKDKNEEEEEE